MWPVLLSIFINHLNYSCMFTRKKTNPLLLAATGLLSILPLLMISCHSGETQNPPQVKTDTQPAPFVKFMQLQRASSIDRFDSRIGPDSVTRMIAGNRQHPIIVDTSGNPVEGFGFKADDYKDLTSRHPTSLFFQFGLKNLTDTTAIGNRTKAAEYTIIVIPLDANGKQLKDAVSGQLVAYDYVCTCVNGVGCCPQQ